MSGWNNTLKILAKGARKKRDDDNRTQDPFGSEIKYFYHYTISARITSIIIIIVIIIAIVNAIVIVIIIVIFIVIVVFVVVVVIIL